MAIEFAILLSGLMIGMGLSSVGSAIRGLRFPEEKYEIQRFRETIEKISKEWLFYLQHRLPPR